MSKKVERKAILISGRYDFEASFYGGRHYQVYYFNQDPTNTHRRDYLFHIGTTKFKYDAGSIVIAEKKLWPTAKRSKLKNPHQYWQIVET
jgi:hypothetical protein